MDAELLNTVIVNLPNLAGLLILAFQQWRIINLLIKYCGDDDEN